VSTPSPGRVLPWPLVYGSGVDSRNASQASQTDCPTDEEAMLRLRQQDTGALDFLFHRYARLVLGTAFRVLRDYGEAEEIVQEVFFQVFQKANLFDQSKGAAKTWIIQIALHRALDRKSFLDRRGFYLDADIECMDDILSSSTDLDRELGVKFCRVQLEKALETLPLIQRQTLELFYFEGFQLRELAEKLGEPLGNIRHHFYRGLERLRENAFIQNLREK
jgi:RNA polymerase sigma-70 factor (ECF subfamily)